MKYIVTGGAGFIGSHIVEELAQRRHEVVVLDNLFSGKMANIAPSLKREHVTFVQGSITDLPLLKKTFQGVDGIFHQAAITSVPGSIKNPVATNEANVTGTLNVLIAAQHCGVKKVVFASSSSVYGDTPAGPQQEEMPPNPKSPYAVSKLTGEYYMRVFAELHDIQTVSLRYFNVFGPRQDPTSEYAAVIPKFITRILKNESPTIFGDGEQTRDFIYVKDVVAANIRAMNSNERGIFNIAGGKSVSINELASLILAIIGENIKPVYENPRSGEIRHSYADIHLAEKAFLFKPEYSLKRALTETIRWYQNQDTTR
jgi:nucleoside-diphosphate-sugar epimerase